MYHIDLVEVPTILDLFLLLFDFVNFEIFVYPSSMEYIAYRAVEPAAGAMV